MKSDHQPASPSTQPSRRNFLKTSAAASLAGSSFLIIGTKASGAIKGANDRVRIAVAGLNGRGQSHINGWNDASNVEIAYVVDPAKKVLSRTMASMERRAAGNFNTKGIGDIRGALDDSNLDAISIATPNHWHSLMTIWGAQAGKHVYVEKPMSHDIAEGRVAVEAQKKYGVVIQHGTQRRSNAGVAGLHEALKSGKLPRLKIAYGYACKPRNGIGFEPISEPPADLDWEHWKGPAVIDHYHANYVPYDWHWFWPTGNGDLNNQGTHQLDVARWAIDDDQTHPVRAMAIGGRFQWDDQGETPNTMFAMAEYANGQMVFFNVRNVNYKDYKRQVINEYYLEDGSVITGEGRYQILRPGAKSPEPLEIEPGDVTPGGNWNAFIAAVRANDPSMANGNVHDAHYGCVLGHIMNNSYRLGSEVPFSAKPTDFGGNEDAVEHFGRLHRIMSDGVGLSAKDANYTLGPMLEFDPSSERFVGERSEEANVLLKDADNPGYEIPSVENV
ncbi:Gfo/Idh/MocA family oxidoreductase [Roseiconus nitratireducens]|uniref:Gfo/Idh/MocA family oxidoreductase n=1 Tax=Roseiconus nitratireducens TaxID=2605748 RepID=A0A5M6DEE8_9BACT|nr:Gfo/Idh/MocA family oxidoreductase [Roseiconus nitratireducens]KAA5545897.1 Gfo/Idh/MocA family oxidoreductase [Roseiconus nitratireducens]